MGDHLWTVPELAAYLGTSVQNTYYLLSNGRIPGVVRLGPRAIRINPTAVSEWAKSGGFSEVAS